MRRTPLRRKSRKRVARDRALAMSRWTVRKRSMGLCEARMDILCSGMGNQAHHVRRRSQGGTDDPANLLWVCARCHTSIHANPDQAVALGLLARGRP